MCLGKAFVEKGDTLDQIMENITDIREENGKLVLTSLLGERQQLEGKLKQIDFNNSKIIITQG